MAPRICTAGGDGLWFDGLPPFEYGRSSAEADVGRRQVVQALVISVVVVVVDELTNALFKLSWQPLTKLALTYLKAIGRVHHLRAPHARARRPCEL